MDVFKVGDLVRIRDWQDMEDEFGTDECGDIPCRASFTTQMIGLCGMEFTIKEITAEGRIRGLEGPYYISEDMIEHQEEEDLAETNDLIEFINNMRVL